MQKHLPIFIVFIIISLILNGCMVAGQSIFSAPNIADTSNGVTSSAIRIETVDLTLGIKAVYEFEPKDIVGILILPPFIPVGWKAEPDPGTVPAETNIEIYIDPKGHQISFRPMQVTLRTSDGKDVMPDGYIGPTSSDDRSSQADHGANRHVYDDMVAVEHQTRFILIFDHPPYPDMNFLLLVNGIKKDGRQLFMLPIQFQQQVAWWFASVP